MSMDYMGGLPLSEVAAKLMDIIDIPLVDNWGTFEIPDTMPPLSTAPPAHEPDTINTEEP